jgi:hypothetical protein
MKIELLSGFQNDFLSVVDLTNSQTVAASRLSFAGAMFVGTCSHSICVDSTVPVIILRALVNCTSILQVFTLFNHTGAQYSAVE